MPQWKWCVEGLDGKVMKGWYEDNGAWYYLNDQGIMQTGWIQDTDKRWYYLDETTGAMQTGWIQLKGIWYYLEPNSNGYMGSCYIDCTSIIDGKTYAFDKDGHLIENKALSDKGAEFVSSWEGFSSTWEDVGDGYWTIGIGTATSGTLGKQLYASGITSCTKEQAYKWLEQECSSCYEAIKGKLDANNITLAQNQIDALISMAYNIGACGLVDSTLFKNILNGVTDEATIRSNFEAWDKCNGVVWDGLKKRRDSEADLYLNADYIGNN
ncbi:lysozyme [Clostridium saccharobutylicum]|uniref:Lysozyme n=1 Tax=Clostridium saccharobutylicum DSM 13864 TaxID=1345695 RepID=U5MRW0_CLOSA|nr:lysozyme [Clostridium saccharobutylicum]AGX43263.1 lysozyme [Clostridium saccharobutylicum DSM 13864]AQR90563.1 autolysin [Clostridium saccharobutylicum]AQS00467.1 autolysin [Clostridium saccharobutylicum]AQS10117.1 autolysin [Clostridium saccharobutylicum]AQS14450.1 autolysin [Clostridium saccharobutylicum]